MKPASQTTHSKFAAILITVLMLCCVFLSRQIHDKNTNSQIVSDEFTLLSPLHSNPVLFKFLSFGHLSASVDALLIKFMTDFEYKPIQKGQKAIQFYPLDLATDLDPLFFNLYIAGASFLTVVRDDPVSALKVITKGEDFRKNRLSEYSKEFQNRYWPFNWRIPLIKGYIHLFEFQDFVSAASTYRELDHLEKVPPVLKSLGERCSKPGGAQEVGIKVLTIMIASEQNEEVKNQLIEKRKKMIEELQNRKHHAQNSKH